MTKLNSQPLLAAIAAASLSIPISVHAQLEEIIVTAQKRGENIQDVPITITGVSETQLAEGRIQTTQDLVAAVPSLNFGEITVFGKVYLRGVGTDISVPGGDSAVATYLDGIYVPGNTNALQVLLGIERIEVLSGPQGTLYGRNATGGAISTYSLTPSQDKEGKITISGGNYDRREISGYISGGVTENLSLGVYGAHLERDPYLDLASGNVTPYFGTQADFRSRPDGEQSQAIRVKGVWEATDKLTITASYEFTDQETIESNTFRNIQPNAIGYGFEPYQVENGTGSILEAVVALLPEFIPGDPRLTPGVIEDYRVETDSPSYNKKEQKVGILRMDYELDNGIQLTSLSGYIDSWAEAATDVDGTAAPLFLSSVQPEGIKDETWSQEFQIKSAADSDYQWIVGAYYMNQEAGFDPLHSSGLLLSFPVFDPTALDFRTLILGTSDIESFAVFGQTTIPLNNVFDGLGLTLGIRYTEDSNEWRDGFSGLETAAGLLPGGVSFAPEKKEWEEITPKLTLDYKFDNGMVYFSYTEGYRAGFYNTSTPAALSVDGALDPETLTAYEIGFKTDWLGNTLRLNGATWFYDYQDIQVNKVVIVDGAISAVLQNAAEAEVYGAELTAIWAATDKLTLNAGVTFMQSEFTNFPDAGAVDLSPTPFFTINSPVVVDATGNDLVRTPEFVFSAAVDYRMPLSSGGELQFNLSGYYNDGFFFDTTNVLDQPSYSLVDAFVRWSSKDDKYSLKLWGKNLGDEHYFVEKQNLLNVAAHDGVARHWGVTFGYNF